MKGDTTGFFRSLLVTFVFLDVIAFFGAGLAWLFDLYDLNDLVLHILHVPLWVLWCISMFTPLPRTNTVIYVTYALSTISFILDFVVAIIEGVSAYNCGGAGPGSSYCPPAPYGAISEGVSAFFSGYFTISSFTGMCTTYLIILEYGKWKQRRSYVKQEKMRLRAIRQQTKIGQGRRTNPTAAALPTRSTHERKPGGVNEQVSSVHSLPVWITSPANSPTPAYQQQLHLTPLQPTIIDHTDGGLHRRPTYHAQPTPGNNIYNIV